MNTQAVTPTPAPAHGFGPEKPEKMMGNVPACPIEVTPIDWARASSTEANSTNIAWAPARIDSAEPLLASGLKEEPQTSGTSDAPPRSAALSLPGAEVLTACGPHRSLFAVKQLSFMTSPSS
jgi:hypothetical protein